MDAMQKFSSHLMIVTVLNIERYYIVTEDIMLLSVRYLIFGSLIVVFGVLSYFFIEPQLYSSLDKVRVLQGTSATVGFGLGMIMLSLVMWKLEKETQLLKRQLAH